jgi:16S rRNA (cytidine1402-2'-O)-methyltransferase
LDENELLPPGLHIVATPIGNLGDLSPRAADVLRRADHILAEDSRVTGKLLARLEAKAPMRRYDDHSSDAAREAIVARLGSEAIALVSDAGTPLISDPGYKLVRAARAAGHRVHTVPGPSAAIAALTLAGLPTDRFMFLGFLPAKAKARADAIAEIAAVRATLVFYESGPRLGASLAAMAHGLGARDAAVAREITKLHEECVTGSLAELAERYADAAPKGEIVIVVGPPAETSEASDAAIDSALDEALARITVSRAAAEVAEQLGVPRKRVYARALERSK